jgi:hypothetical protein
MMFETTFSSSSSNLFTLNKKTVNSTALANSHFSKPNKKDVCSIVTKKYKSLKQKIYWRNNRIEESSGKKNPNVRSAIKIAINGVTVQKKVRSIILADLLYN